jgi:hypothetical protein
VSPLLSAVGLGTAAAVLGDRAGVRGVTFLHVVVGSWRRGDRAGSTRAGGLVCAQPLPVFGRIFRPLLRVMNGTGKRWYARSASALGMLTRCTRLSSLLVSERATPARSGSPVAFSATSSA